MLRIEEPDHWLLVTHQDHARLAGKFAQAWGNKDFAPPEPLRDVLLAVTRHDDAWTERDAKPRLGRDGRPAAFSRELVGSYTAFEEIELAEYLRVRGQATEAVAGENAYAAILVSMHTLNLLTEQADLSKLSPDDLARHRDFVNHQRARQQALIALVSREPRRQNFSTTPYLDRAFRFLQACDSLSLAACVRYSKSLPLRHRHPLRDGTSTTLDCLPLGRNTYRVYPYPFASDELVFPVPCRRIAKQPFSSHDAVCAAYADAPQEYFTVKIFRTAPAEFQTEALSATSS